MGLAFELVWYPYASNMHSLALRISRWFPRWFVLLLKSCL